MARSPRRRIRLASVADGLTIARSPVGRDDLHQLGASHGRQDHTVLPSAASFTRRPRPGSCAAGRSFPRGRLSAVRLRAVRSLTSRSSPCEHIARPTLPRPPQSVPTFVTTADAPLAAQVGGSFTSDLPDGLSGELATAAKYVPCHVGQINLQAPGKCTVTPTRGVYMSSSPDARSDIRGRSDCHPGYRSAHPDSAC
jgi:hypothetical protein